MLSIVGMLTGMATLATAGGNPQVLPPNPPPAVFDSHQEARTSGEDARLVDRPDAPPARTPPSARKRALRMGLEQLGALGAGSIWYWSNQDFNSPDWALQWSWADWKKKVTLEQVRFDDNFFDTN